MLMAVTASVHSERGGGDYLTLMDRIRRNPSVESICFTTGVHFHYRGSNQYATFRKDSLIRNGFVRFVSPTYFEVFGVKTAEGGSPSELVDALRDNQVVVTGRVADDFFGDPSAAVRQEIYITDQGSRDSVAYRIGGVCEKQRYCEFTGYDYAYYKLVDENKVAEEGDWVGEGLNTFIRVKPGADGAAFATNFRKEMEQQLRVGNIYLKDVFPMSIIEQSVYYRTVGSLPSSRFISEHRCPCLIIPAARRPPDASAWPGKTEN
jgi:putative ABC transport system permease protein